MIPNNPEAPLNFSDLFTFQEKQREAFSWIGKKSRILYGGARGGGKTAWAVAVAVLASLQFPGLRTAIVRRHHDELMSQIVMAELLKRYPQTFYKFKRSTKTAEFNNGSVIFFRALQHPEDVEKEQGIERGLYILDEGNQLEEMTIRKLMGSLRSFDIPNWKPTLIITANPGGTCDDYVKSRWIRPDFSKWESEELEMKDEYVFVKATVYDNNYASKDYVATLKSMPEDLRRAWLEGDWDVASGQFFTEWNEPKHVLHPFDIPKEWVRWRAIDLGYGSHPSVCLLAAQHPETGRLYVYDEISTTLTTDIFIEMIKERCKDDVFVETFFDPGSMSGRMDTADQMSPATMFERAGMPVTKAMNQREIGWRNLKQWLHWQGESVPLLQVFENCHGLRETIPLQRYKDFKFDLDTRGKDDYVDALRYLTSHIMYRQIYYGSGVYVPVDEEKARERRGKNERVETQPRAYSSGAEKNYYQVDDYITSPYSVY